MKASPRTSTQASRKGLVGGVGALLVSKAVMLDYDVGGSNSGCGWDVGGSNSGCGCDVSE